MPIEIGVVLVFIALIVILTIPGLLGVKRISNSVSDFIDDQSVTIKSIKKLSIKERMRHVSIADALVFLSIGHYFYLFGYPTFLFRKIETHIDNSEIKLVYLRLKIRLFRVIEVQFIKHYDI